MHNSFLHYIIWPGAQCCTTEGLVKSYLNPPKKMIVFRAHWDGKWNSNFKSGILHKKFQVTLSTSLRSPVNAKLDWRFSNVKYAFREYCLRCESIFGLFFFFAVLSSHSAIFQLYSDDTVVQLPNLDLLLGTQRLGQLWYLVFRAYPTGTLRGRL